MNQVFDLSSIEEVIKDGDKIFFMGDETLTSNVCKFKEFDEGVTCNVGEYYRHDDNMYICINQHIGVFGDGTNFNQVRMVTAKQLSFTINMQARFTIEDRPLLFGGFDYYTLRDIHTIEFIAGSVGAPVSFIGEY